MVLLVKRLLLWSSIFLTGCSIPPFSRQDAAPPAPPSCVIAEQNLSAKERGAIAELRRNMEAGPLYLLSATRAGVATCSAKYETGVLTLEYNFRDKGWLRVK